LRNEGNKRVLSTSSSRRSSGNKKSSKEKAITLENEMRRAKGEQRRSWFHGGKRLETRMGVSINQYVNKSIRSKKLAQEGNEGVGSTGGRLSKGGPGNGAWSCPREQKGSGSVGEDRAGQKKRVALGAGNSLLPHKNHKASLFFPNCQARKKDLGS